MTRPLEVNHLRDAKDRHRGVIEQTRRESDRIGSPVPIAGLVRPEAIERSTTSPRGIGSSAEGPAMATGFIRRQMELVDEASRLYSHKGKMYKLVHQNVYAEIGTGRQFSYHAPSSTLAPYPSPAPGFQLVQLGFQQAEVNELLKTYDPRQLDDLARRFAELEGVPPSLVTFLVAKSPRINLADAAVLAEGASNRSWYTPWTLRALELGVPAGDVVKIWRLVAGCLDEQDFLDIASAVHNGTKIDELARTFSTDTQRRALTAVVQRFAPYGTDWSSAKKQILNDLQSVCPFLIPTDGPMWHDVDPILRLLARAFQSMLDRIEANEHLFLTFTKAPGLIIKGVSLGSIKAKGRTFLDYIGGARVDCAQATEGEMMDWIKMINDFKS